MSLNSINDYSNINNSGYRIKDSVVCSNSNLEMSIVSARSKLYWVEASNANKQYSLIVQFTLNHSYVPTEKLEQIIRANFAIESSTGESFHYKHIFKIFAINILKVCKSKIEAKISFVINEAFCSHITKTLYQISLFDTVLLPELAVFNTSPDGQNVSLSTIIKLNNHLKEASKLEKLSIHLQYNSQTSPFTALIKELSDQMANNCRNPMEGISEVEEIEAGADCLLGFRNDAFNRYVESKIAKIQKFVSEIPKDEVIEILDEIESSFLEKNRIAMAKKNVAYEFYSYTLTNAVPFLEKRKQFFIKYINKYLDVIDSYGIPSGAFSLVEKNGAFHVCSKIKLNQSQLVGMMGGVYKVSPKEEFVKNKHFVKLDNFKLEDENYVFFLDTTAGSNYTTQLTQSSDPNVEAIFVLLPTDESLKEYSGTHQLLFRTKRPIDEYEILTVDWSKTPVSYLDESQKRKEYSNSKQSSPKRQKKIDNK